MKLVSCKLAVSYSVFIFKVFLMKMHFYGTILWHIIKQKTKGLIPDVLKTTHMYYFVTILTYSTIDV